MITHLINKYAIPHNPYTPPHVPTRYQGPVTLAGQEIIPRTVGRHTSKIVYTRWIEQQKIRLRVGEYCMHQSHIHQYKDRTPEMYHRVLGWQEVQMLLQWDEQDRPKALQLINRDGESEWVVGEDWRFICSPARDEWCFPMPPAA